jgi:hypothetical protein
MRAACNKGCHPPTPCVVIGELTQRVAARLEHGPGLAQPLFPLAFLK